ncbi:MAG TPA: hypothetical protein VF940_00680 [Streptosporangiaceae bacterium]
MRLIVLPLAPGGLGVRRVLPERSPSRRAPASGDGAGYWIAPAVSLPPRSVIWAARAGVTALQPPTA